MYKQAFSQIRLTQTESRPRDRDLAPMPGTDLPNG